MKWNIWSEKDWQNGEEEDNKFKQCNERYVSENILRWCRCVERRNKNKLVKRIFKNEYCGRRRVVEGWVDNMRDCMREKSLTERQANATVHDNDSWEGFLR